MNKKVKMGLLITLMLVISIAIIFNREEPEKIVVDGYNVEQLNLQINMNVDKEFVDPNFSYVPTFSKYHLTEKIDFVTIDPPYTIKNMTTIGINYTDNGIDTTFFPVLYLQGFYKKEISEKNHFIKIEDKYYKNKQLIDYIVYEDKNVIVYNISNLINFYDIDTKISKLSNMYKEKNYDYTWIKGMHDYFLNNNVLKIYKQL
ncbi:hypothetical protein [Abyssisolibacter fermentans]|uniref:hypothetical protein n=1 Tax=Abyssisolibacter fermentans TaxID=1766203 RepID=UPI0008332E2C|nr:hypothetical protein [Abyssisolibacter fermentans]